MSFTSISEATSALETAILTYRSVRLSLDETSDQISYSSQSRSPAVRRDAFQQLTELGQRRVHSERTLRQTALAARRVLTPEAIEAIALQHDGKESDDSALTLIRTVLFQNGRM